MAAQPDAKEFAERIAKVVMDQVEPVFLTLINRIAVLGEEVQALKEQRNGRP